MKRRLPIDDLRAGRISVVNPPARFTPRQRVTLEGSKGLLVGRVLSVCKSCGHYWYEVDWDIHGIWRTREHELEFAE